LVINQTRVFPARLAAQRSTGGRVEVLLLERLYPVGDASEPEQWICLLKASKRLRGGEELFLEEYPQLGPAIRLLGPPQEGRCQVVIKNPRAVLEIGAVPLPPYIQRSPEPADLNRYQTIYAQDEGSVAAPTAGLHLSEAIFDALEERGIQIIRITLHVGPGTFQPVRTHKIEDHDMEEERYEVSEQAASQIQAARREGRAVIAVGTTVVRTLESTRGEAGAGRTRLFIKPGYTFQVVDGLLTNFHLPRSTLLMLVSAFAGREVILSAYQHAIEQKYRFYSYGDAMLIL
jgi:S-adenosylmethionine:tRNA ribosyltransferase-isomerase